MSKDKNNQDDWSVDSASLFRDARRAHDPTSSELATIDAIYTRIRASGHTPPVQMERAPGNAVPGVTRSWLRQLATRSMVLVLVVAGSLSLIRGLRQTRQTGQTTEPASGQQPAPPVAASPAPVEPAPTPETPRDDPQPLPAPVVARQAESRPHAQPHRTPANVASRRGAAKGKASLLDARASGPELETQSDDISSTPARSDEAIQPVSSEALAPAVLDKPQRITAQRASATEPEAQAAAAPAAQRNILLPADSAVSELALLKRIHEELRASDYAAALSLCAEHEQRWPHGTFELEREGVRAIASCATHAEDAARRARQFLEAHPHAALAMRVRSTCVAQLKPLSAQ